LKNLQIKDRTFRQNKTEGPSTEDTVAALYHALNVMKAYHHKYLELKNEANELTTQLEPLEKVKLIKRSSMISILCIYLD
jgi:hypothetical protein